MSDEMHYRAVDNCFRHLADARWHARWTLAMMLGHQPHPILVDDAVFRCPGRDVCNLPAEDAEREAS